MFENQLFPLGQLTATPACRDYLQEKDISPILLLKKHATGDWSEMSADDQQSNSDSIKEGDRVFSAYTIDKQKIYVITEADRSLTTLLFADEY